MEYSKSNYEEHYDLARYMAGFAEKMTAEFIDKWLTKYKVGGANGVNDTFALNRSITVTPIFNGSELVKIEVRMLKYGQYVDMGVGRGMPVGTKQSNPTYYDHRNERGQLYKHKFRKPKPGYSKVMAHSAMRIGEILSDRFGMTIVGIIDESLPETIAA